MGGGIVCQRNTRCSGLCSDCGNLTGPGYKTMFSVPVWPRRLLHVSTSRFKDEFLERRQKFNAAGEGISRFGIGIGIGTDEKTTAGLLMK
jgi:hypothetical protein